MPGFWDMHAHASQIEWAPAYLAAGVTTIRDMGGERAFLVAFRDALAAKRGPGPRMLLAGLIDGEAPNAFGLYTASTPEAGRALVDRYHADRFEQMKLYSLIQPPVVDAVIARAHELGMTVTGHVPSALGIRRAVEAGMDHVAHMPVGGDPQAAETKQTIELLAKRGVVIDPTLPWGEVLGRAAETPVDQIEPGLKSGPPALVMNYRSVTNQGDAAAARARVERSLATLKAVHAAGVPIVAGTDGAVPGHSLLRAHRIVGAGRTDASTGDPNRDDRSRALDEARQRRRHDRTGQTRRPRRPRRQSARGYRQHPADPVGRGAGQDVRTRAVVEIGWVEIGLVL